MNLTERLLRLKGLSTAASCRAPTTGGLLEVASDVISGVVRRPDRYACSCKI